MMTEEQRELSRKVLHLQAELLLMRERLEKIEQELDRMYQAENGGGHETHCAA